MKQLIFTGIVVFAIALLFTFTGSSKGNSASSYKNPVHNFLWADTVVPVKIQLEQTTMNDMFVLFIRDTAATTESMKDLFNKDYGELMQFVQQNNLQPRKFMAWYYSMQAPWPIDVAVETNQLPATLTGRIQSRTEKGGAVLIAHIRGPYDQVGQAYAAIQKSLGENHLKSKSAPFEVYITDPATAKDPSEIQTDVYQPVE
jgi:effector-binding domain-containing protein